MNDLPEPYMQYLFDPPYAILCYFETCRAMCSREGSAYHLPTPSPLRNHCLLASKLSGMLITHSEY